MLSSGNMAAAKAVPQECPQLYIRTAQTYRPVYMKSCMHCCPASVGLVTTGAGNRVRRHTCTCAPLPHSPPKKARIFERKERLAPSADCVTERTNIDLVSKCTNGF